MGGGAVLYMVHVLWNVHVRKGRALKLCQISFHALQSTASETVTFTWPSIPPTVAAGPKALAKSGTRADECGGIAGSRTRRRRLMCGTEEAHRVLLFMLARLQHILSRIENFFFARTACEM